jgi:hypothetical protein
MIRASLRLNLPKEWYEQAPIEEDTADVAAGVPLGQGEVKEGEERPRNPAPTTPSGITTASARRPVTVGRPRRGE